MWVCVMFYPEKGKKYRTIQRNYVDYRQLNRRNQIRQVIIIVVAILVILAALGFIGYYLGFWKYLYDTVILYYFRR